MIRRDFFKTLAAAAAAFAASKSTALALPSPAPKPATIDSHEATIRKLLKECVVVGFGRHKCLASGCWNWEVEYIYDPDRKYLGARLNDELSRMMPKDAGMRSVSIETTQDIDVFHLGAYSPPLVGNGITHRITVEWVTA
jgi:hypothetical protein